MSGQGGFKLIMWRFFFGYETITYMYNKFYSGSKGVEYNKICTGSTGSILL